MRIFIRTSTYLPKDIPLTPFVFFMNSKIFKGIGIQWYKWAFSICWSKKLTPNVPFYQHLK
jgi:hypothetical protein